MLLAGRVVQGIGGGGLLILVNICISDLFSLRFAQGASLPDAKVNHSIGAEVYILA